MAGLQHTAVIAEFGALDGAPSGSLLEMLRSGADDLLDFDALEELLGTDLAAGEGPVQGWGAPVADPLVEQRFGQVTTTLMPGTSDHSSQFEARARVSDGHAATAAGPAGALQPPVKPESLDNAQVDESNDGGFTEDGQDGKKKKRTRTNAQMQHNRVAQQKYRERKKAEQTELQAAVERLTASLAAMKTIELRNQELEAHAARLSLVSTSQQGRIAQLEQQVSDQARTLSTQAQQMEEQQKVVASQQSMILDQHTKIKLQEEIIAQLKDRIKESVDQAWSSMGNPDPASVCKKMHLAVRAALENATDMEGLQVMLATIPDGVVVSICKNIMHQCKDMWPNVYAALPHVPCSQMVGSVSAV